MRLEKITAILSFLFTIPLTLTAAPAAVAVEVASDSEPYVNWDERLGNGLASRFLDIYSSFDGFEELVLPQFTRLDNEGYDFVYGQKGKRTANFVDRLRFERTTARGTDYVELVVPMQGGRIQQPTWNVMDKAEFAAKGTDFFLSYVNIPDNPGIKDAALFDQVRWLAENHYRAAFTGYVIEDGRFQPGPFIVDEQTGESEVEYYLVRKTVNDPEAITKKLAIRYLPSKAEVLEATLADVSPDDATELQTVFATNVSATSLIGFDEEKITSLADFAAKIEAAAPSLEVVSTYQYFITVKVRDGHVFTSDDLKALQGLPEFRYIEPNGTVSITGKTSSAG